MALTDPNAQNVALDAVYGDGKAAGAPSSIEVAMFNGDPDNGGTELTAGVGGYARLVLANTTANFPDAVGGLKSVPVDLGDATDAFDLTITHWQFYDHADGTTRYDSGRFANPIDVTGPGPVAGVCTVYFGSLQ